ncbi:MAG: DUF167 domain-containing protein [Chlamydiota bacterium]
MALYLALKVTPNASKNQVIGWEGNLLRVKIRGVPEKGRVNQELIEFLSDLLGIAPSRLELIQGATSRLKRVKIEGMSQSELDAKLPPK